MGGYFPWSTIFANFMILILNCKNINHENYGQVQGCGQERRQCPGVRVTIMNTWCSLQLSCTLAPPAIV